jgi:hypothetical protein
MIAAVLVQAAGTWRHLGHGQPRCSRTSGHTQAHEAALDATEAHLMAQIETKRFQELIQR